MADDFYFPEGYLRRNGINPAAVMPESARSALSLVPRGFQVRSKSDAKDLAYRMGGRSSKPTTAPRLLGPDGTPIIIWGGGVTEAAELEDLAIEAIEKAETGAKTIDFEESREARGLPSHKEFMPLLQQAAEDYTKKKKATSITDPAPPMKGQTLHGYIGGTELPSRAEIAAWPQEGDPA